ncbi:MAG: hypothetical protein KDJ35_00940 [Alphaproteobacteria bacterium]|nr:hypothetical protein [Alphaproteobacteria bacterium]
MSFAFFTVDLALDGDDKPYILEFNNGMQSGFSGFERSTGKNMLNDIVLPNLVKRNYKKFWLDHVFAPKHPLVSSAERKYRIPLLNTDIYLSVGEQKLKKQFMTCSATNQILFPRPPYRSDIYSKFSRVAISHRAAKIQQRKAQRAGNNNITVAGDSQTYMALCEDKSFYAKITDTLNLNGKISPYQKAYTLPELKKGIPSEFKNKDRFVIKAVSLCRGEGIKIATSANYTDILESVIEENRYYTHGASQSGDQEVYVLQEFIDTPPMSIKEAYDAVRHASFLDKKTMLGKISGKIANHFYGKVFEDSTDALPRRHVIRLALTFEKDNKVHLHDGYRKFSADIYDDTPEDDVSDDAFKSEAAYAAPILIKEKQRIFKALESDLNTVMNHVFTHDKLYPAP